MRPALDAAAQQLSAAQQLFQEATAHAKQATAAANSRHQPSVAATFSAHAAGDLPYEQWNRHQVAFQSHHTAAAPDPSHQTRATGQHAAAKQQAASHTRQPGFLPEAVTDSVRQCSSRKRSDRPLSLAASHDGVGDHGGALLQPASMPRVSASRIQHAHQPGTQVQTKPRKKRSSRADAEHSAVGTAGRSVIKSPEHAATRHKKLKGVPIVVSVPGNATDTVSKQLSKHAGHAEHAVFKHTLRRSPHRHRRGNNSTDKQTGAPLAPHRSPVKSPARRSGEERALSSPLCRPYRSPGKDDASCPSPRMSPVRHRRCLGCQAGIEDAVSRSPSRLDQSPGKPVKSPWKPSGCVHQAKPDQAAWEDPAQTQTTSPQEGTSCHAKSNKKGRVCLDVAAPFASDCFTATTDAAPSATAAAASQAAVSTADHAASGAHHSTDGAGLTDITTGQHRVMQMSQPDGLRGEAVLHKGGLAEAQAEPTAAGLQPKAVHELHANTLTATWHTEAAVGYLHQHGTHDQRRSSTAGASQQMGPADGIAAGSKHAGASDQASDKLTPRGIQEHLGRADDEEADCSSCTSSSGETEAQVDPSILQRGLSGLLQRPVGSQLPSMADIAHIFMQRQRARMVLQVSFLMTCVHTV